MKTNVRIVSVINVLRCQNKNCFGLLKRSMLLLFISIGIQALYVNQIRAAGSYPENNKQYEPLVGLTTPQQGNLVVKGNVQDSTGEPLISVTVYEKGTSNGSLTDLDGNYTIQLQNPNGVLVFSYIGFETEEKPVNGNQVINVILRAATTELDDVIVVAYGTQKKSSVTGSIAIVKGDDLKNVTAPNVASMLQGKVAGVSVSGTSGKPGQATKIRIRGKGSMMDSESNDPLWVIDGVVGGLTSQLNPNDIESISILKDASATALYGSRATNGVILVTTKSGKMGTNTIRVDAKLGIATLQRGNLKMMNSKELYDYTDAAFKNRGVEGAALSWFRPELMENDTDWFDFVTQNALSQNYTISYTMGNEKTRAFLSADYYSEEGTVKGYDYQRFTVRSNVDHKVNDRLTLKTRISGNYWEDDSQEYSIYSSNTYLPWDTPYNSNGIIKTGKEGTDFDTSSNPKDLWFGCDGNNFLYDNQFNWARGRQFGIDGNFGLEYRITEYLVFESTNNIGFRYHQTEQYVDPNSISGQSRKGYVEDGTQYTNNKYANQLLRFNHSFNNLHDVSAFLGFEYSDFYFHSNAAGGRGIPPGGETVNVSAAPVTATSNKYMSKTMAYYFNTNYTYDNRYMLQFSFRRDGSSKFGRNNKFGNFFTIGGGWNMHNEAFMKSVDFVNQLKLRVGYGSVGNAPNAMYAHMGLYRLSYNYNEQAAAFPSQLANRDLTWEKCYTTNFAVDARLFDRLNITAEYYIKNTSDLLYVVDLSTLTGYQSQYRNVGAVKNTGVEFTISPEIIKTKDWFWTIDFNIGYNKNRIKELYNDNAPQIQGKKRREVGYDMDTWYLKEWAGVDAATGEPLWFKVDEDGNKSVTKSEADATRVMLGTGSPKVTGGILTNLSYRDFTLGASFAFATGHYVYHSGREAYDSDGTEIQFNTMRLHKGWVRWEKPGDIASHPQVIHGGNNKANVESSRYLEKGDFFKMQSLSLSYTIPSKLLNKIKLGSASVYVSAENLFILTPFSGPDVEIASGDSNSGVAEATGYPTPRRVSFGLNFSF